LYTNSLYYYDPEDLVLPLGVIELESDCSVVQTNTEPKKKFQLDIITPTRTYSMYSENETDVQKWVKNLNQVITNPTNSTTNNNKINPNNDKKRSMTTIPKVFNEQQSLAPLNQNKQKPPPNAIPPMQNPSSSKNTIPSMQTPTTTQQNPTPPMQIPSSSKNAIPSMQTPNSTQQNSTPMQQSPPSTQKVIIQPPPTSKPSPLTLRAKVNMDDNISTTTSRQNMEPVPFGAKPFNATPTKPDDLWSCQSCTYYNLDQNVRCKMCQAPKPIIPKAWDCPKCYFEGNKPYSLNCENCATAKPGISSAPVRTNIPSHYDSILKAQKIVSDKITNENKEKAKKKIL